MSDEPRSAADLVRRLRARAKFLNPKNPERHLLEEAVQCIGQLAMRVHALETATHAPTVRSAGRVQVVREVIEEVAGHLEQSRRDALEWPGNETNESDAAEGHTD